MTKSSIENRNTTFFMIKGPRPGVDWAWARTMTAARQIRKEMVDQSDGYKIQDFKITKCSEPVAYKQGFLRYMNNIARELGDDARKFYRR